jgi:hypothetical protein
MNLCELTYSSALSTLLNDKLIKSFKIDKYGSYYWDLKNYEYSRINNGLSYYHHLLTYTIVNKFKDDNKREYFKAITTAFENAVQGYLTKSHRKDIIAVYLTHPSLDESIYLKLKRVKDFEKKDFANELCKYFYNKNSVLEKGDLILELVIYKYESINSL